MSKKLENFVRDHRDDFDLLEPNAALWKNIESRLKPGKTRNLGILLKAAAVVLIFGLSFWAQMQMEEKPQNITRYNYHSSDKQIAQEATPEKEETPAVNRQPVYNLAPEFAETEKYYTRKVNNTMKELKVYLVKYPEVAVDMKKDLAELDSVYRTLKNDLGDNVAQEEILSAMIQNYRMKLQLLEDIKSELMQNSATKPNQNNGHEI